MASKTTIAAFIATSDWLIRVTTKKIPSAIGG